MTMKLCLDSLTLNDTDPAHLILIAGKAGFDLVSLWVQPPSIFPQQLVTPAKARACAAALADTGIQVGPLEVFNLGSAEAVRSYRPALELGAKLGAKTASAINVANHDQAAVSALFAQFAEQAREFGLGATLEPLARLATATVAQARDIIRASGADGGIVLDVLHLVRMGGTASDVRGLEPGLIRHVQLCDGVASPTPEALKIEATYERMYPSEGVFPLVELLRDAPTNVSWGIEAPSRRRVGDGMSAEAQAVEAMASVRRLIRQIESNKQNGPGY
jgi:sugar phosphate isomerase/epimerase